MSNPNPPRPPGKRPHAEASEAQAGETALVYVEILGMLSPHTKTTTARIVERLAERGLARTPRTVQRIMGQLSERFVNIEIDQRSKPYGYGWKRGEPNPWNPELDDRQALVLMLAKQHLEPLLPHQVVQSLDPLFQEARRRLDPYHGARPLRSWLRKVAVVSELQPLLPPQIAEDVFGPVTSALQSDEWLEVDYRNFAGQPLADRRVMPLALVQQGSRLFLVCRFEGYEDTRHLALHRLLSARLTGQPFERPTFDLQAYIDRGGFGFGSGERIALRLRLAPHIAELLRETPLSADQRMEAVSPEGIDLSATVVRSEQLRWRLRSLGAAVQVLEPSGLLDEPLAGVAGPTTPTEPPARLAADQTPR